jgi:hypothetical protein
MNEELENQLKNELLEACRISREKFNYNPIRILQMLHEQKADEIAIQLITSPEPGEGFTKMWEKKALYLTVEAHVIKPEYAPLFTHEVIEKARTRLHDYGYEVS